MFNQRVHDVEVQIAVVCRVEAPDYADAREKASSTIQGILSNAELTSGTGVQALAEFVHPEPQRGEGPEELARLRQRLNGCQKQIRAFVRACDSLPLDDPEYVEGIREDFLAAMAHHSRSDIRRGLEMLVGSTSHRERPCATWMRRTRGPATKGD